MLNLEQKIEMNEKFRELMMSGRPQEAREIKAALNEGRYFIGHVAEVIDPVEIPKPNASKKAWIEYAKEVSDFDEEVVEKLSKKDLIAMLKANNLT